VDVLDQRLVLLTDPDQLHDPRLWHGEALSACPDDEGGEDGESQRDPHPHRGTSAHCRGDVHAATDPLDVRPDHVHADASAGDAGYFRRGREAGLEYETENLVLAQRGGDVGSDQPTLHRLATDRLDIQALAVVPDFNDDVPALMK